MNIVATTWTIIIPNRTFLECPKIHMVEQAKGPEKFAVRYYGQCLNNIGEWEDEPLPSSRDVDFLNRCRFDTFTDAAKALENNLDTHGIEQLFHRG